MPSSRRKPLPEETGAGQKVVRLGHDLRNSTTILLGILDRLEELKGRFPPLEEIAGDLDHTVNQIQEVAQALSEVGHDLKDAKAGDC